MSVQVSLGTVYAHIVLNTCYLYIVLLHDCIDHYCMHVLVHNYVKLQYTSNLGVYSMHGMDVHV